MTKWINNCARVLKKKPKEEGGKPGYFLIFERQKDKDKKYIGESPFPMVINEGDIFQMRAKEDDLAGLVKAGKMSQETADNICKTVRYELSRAPDKNASEQPATTTTEAKPNDTNKGGVNF